MPRARGRVTRQPVARSPRPARRPVRRRRGVGRGGVDV